MRVAQSVWTAAAGWSVPLGTVTPASLVLVFGARGRFHETAVLEEIRSAFSSVPVVGCSTAGEIAADSVLDDSVVLTAVTFEHTTVRCLSAPLPDASSSLETGRALGRQLDAPDLRHVLLFSEGVHVNGTDLAAGVSETLRAGVVVTGGLAGDGAAFEETCVIVDGQVRPRVAVAVGFHGTALHIGHGSLGGWDTFGPDRVITRSKDNVLFELDGESALALYRRYLGPHAADLPASGLLFPLALLGPNREPGVVRTILGINDADGSLTFAGDVPQGRYARLMRANMDRLIDGATGAATTSRRFHGAEHAALALLVSCVGRKLVLGVRTVEEVESVRDVLGPGCALAGFYSYGEISPLTPHAKCDLHNQTMTITTFSEG
jgi:hypothetical protein